MLISDLLEIKLTIEFIFELPSCIVVFSIRGKNSTNKGSQLFSFKLFKLGQVATSSNGM